ncbi:carbamate kinase domain protein [Burkholderia pseudomallei]|nr:carbamate kinase domain protein [Burkholderia pseudomallei]
MAASPRPAVANPVDLHADPRAGAPLGDRDDVGERADHRVMAGLPREFDRRLHLRPHRAGREAEPLEFVRMRGLDQRLRRLAPVEVRAVDVGRDHEQVRAQFAREQRRAQILVDHRLDARELAVRVVARRNAAAARADHDRAFLEQPLHRPDLEDAPRPRARHDAAELVAVGRDVPAFFPREPLGLVARVDGADRLGRMLERRIGRVHLDLREQRRERRVGRQQVAHFLFDQIADHPFRLRAEHVERVGRDRGVRRALQREQADLRPVAVRDHELVARRDLRDLRDRDLHVLALLDFGHRLIALQERVAAQCDDDTHHVSPCCVNGADGAGGAASRAARLDRARRAFRCRRASTRGPP